MKPPRLAQRAASLWPWLVIAGLACWVRTIGLSERYFWMDEFYTRHRIAGYTKQEIIPKLVEQPVSLESAADFSRPKADATIWSSAAITLRENTQHTPLYSQY